VAAMLEELYANEPRDAWLAVVAACNGVLVLLLQWFLVAEWVVVEVCVYCSTSLIRRF